MFLSMEDSDRMDEREERQTAEEKIDAEEYLDDELMDEETEERDAADRKNKEDKKLPGSGAFDWAQILVFSVIPVVLFFCFIGRTIGVEGSSMHPTLEERDRVIISRLFYTPKQGDIVVISKRSELFPDPIIKRVIATEGQTIRFNFDTGEVWVDGDLLEEEYIAEATRRKEDLQSGVDYKVPDDCVFVMGDNRNRSSDSRRNEIGMVDERNILGRVLIRLFPLKQFGRVR